MMGLHNAFFWFGATLFWTLVMSFYSSQEMACISLNKLRLGYAVKEGKRWAKWLHSLIDNPTKLFSTTLIGVNVALMASSECARELYKSLGLNPNLAPLTHIPFVLLFGELVPMFAARIHAEHMSRLGIPFLYLSAKILTPFTFIVNVFFKYICRFLGRQEVKEANAFLSREELQKLIEEHHVGASHESEEPFAATIENIFSLRKNQAFQLMEKLSDVHVVSSHTTVKAAAQLFIDRQKRYILVYHRLPHKIIGVILPQDLVEAHDNKKIGDYIRPCCFVSEHTHGLELLSRLQEEGSSIAVVLSGAGEAIGVVTIDDLYDELFHSPTTEEPAESQHNYLEKTFSADTKIADINAAYNMSIDPEGCTTFAELIEQTLGRNAAVDDTIFIDPIEIIVKETSLFKAKTILIRTK